MKSILQNVPLERAAAQMGSLLLIAVDHILKCDRLHFFLCFLLDLVKKILKRQLNIDAHAALRGGVYAFRNTVAGQGTVRVQYDESEDVDGVAEFC